MATVTSINGYAVETGRRHSNAAKPRETTVDESEAIELAKAMKELLDNKNFQKVIIDGYINKVALDIGTSFTGDKSDIEVLSAITHLTNHINSVLTDGDIAKA